MDQPYSRLPTPSSTPVRGARRRVYDDTGWTFGYRRTSTWRSSTRDPEGADAGVGRKSAAPRRPERRPPSRSPTMPTPISCASASSPAPLRGARRGAESGRLHLPPGTVLVEASEEVRRRSPSSAASRAARSPPGPRPASTTCRCPGSHSSTPGSTPRTKAGSGSPSKARGSLRLPRRSRSRRSVTSATAGT